MQSGAGGYPCYSVHANLAGSELKLADRTVSGDVASVRGSFLLEFCAACVAGFWISQSKRLVVGEVGELNVLLM